MHCWPIETIPLSPTGAAILHSAKSVCIATALFGRMHINGGWPLQGFAGFVHVEISRLYCDEYGIKPLPFEYQFN